MLFLRCVQTSYLLKPLCEAVKILLLNTPQFFAVFIFFKFFEVKNIKGLSILDLSAF